MVTAHDEKVWLAEAILRNRKRRTVTLRESIFAEHPWDALLHLFVADARSDSLKGDDLADLTGCSRGVMSRWIKHLGAEGLIEGDGHGEMGKLLVLSAKALNAIEAYLADTQDLAREFLAVRDLRGRDGERPLQPKSGYSAPMFVYPISDIHSRHPGRSAQGYNECRTLGRCPSTHQAW